MNAFALITAAGVSALAALSPADAERGADLYRNFLQYPDSRLIQPEKVNALSDDDRQLVVEYLHELIARSRETMPEDLARINFGVNLAVLGDQWGLEAAEAKIRGGFHSSALWTFKFVRNAKLIPMVSDLLFKEEESESNDDLVYVAAQETVAAGMIETFKYSAQFQPDIRQWGQDLANPRIKRDDVIAVLREWYRTNEEKLRAGAFMDIRPGRMPPPVPAASVSPNARETASHSPADSIPVAVTTRVELETKSYVVEIIAGAAFALLAVVVFLWKRRT